MLSEQRSMFSMNRHTFEVYYILGIFFVRFQWNHSQQEAWMLLGHSTLSFHLQAFHFFAVILDMYLPCTKFPIFFSTNLEILLCFQPIYGFSWDRTNQDWVFKFTFLLIYLTTTFSFGWGELRVPSMASVRMQVPSKFLLYNWGYFHTCIWLFRSLHSDY